MRQVAALVIVVSTLPFAVLLFKAKGWLCLIALFLPLGGFVVAVTGASRLAKPHSWWARNLYRDEQLARASARYGDAPKAPATLLAWVGALMLASLGTIAVLYAIGLIDA